MYELLNIDVKNGKQLVSGRDLHEYLEVKSKYADWIKNRINKYDFKEGQDFATLSKSLESGGREYDHALTIEMAKEVAMVENNEKGKMARRYFIQCENLTKQLMVYYDEKLIKITDRLDRTEKLIGLRTRTKFNYGKYIKNKMGINRATKEYENVKMVLFAELGVKMWEEIDYSLDVIAKIDEILETLKLDNQLTYIK